MTESPISLSEPDFSEAEVGVVQATLGRGRLCDGPMVEAFEAEFSGYVGRRHAIAVHSGTTGLLLALKAADIGEGDEVITSGYGWRQIAQAIPWSGARPVLADIDYWSQTLSPDKAEAALTPRTKAILAGNANGHPADWSKLRELAGKSRTLLIEDASESIGSRYQDKPVGAFGDVAIFDFSQPSALCCGQAAMVVTDDDFLALKIRHYRNRRPDEKHSLTATLRPALDVHVTEISAALGLVQLRRLDELLQRRRRVSAWYTAQISSFEGIKPPYVAPHVGDMHWFLYVVHLGTRFCAGSRDALVHDLETAGVESCAFCHPMHLQRAYVDQYGYRKGSLPMTERVSDRAIALPFHANLDEAHIAFIIKTAKDASLNVGAGSAIYL